MLSRSRKDLLLKKYVSQEFGIPKITHANFDFVNVDLFKDHELFIDPCLIALSNDDWCKTANAKINSFFDEFFYAYRTRDAAKKRQTLAHAHEVSFTRLGYGNNNISGRGNTVDGLLHKFSGLDELIAKVPISKPIDLAVFIHDFDKDGLSDMLTNILHRELNEFTLEQCKKYGVEPNASDTFWSWDTGLKKWVEINQPCYFAPNGKLLLVPKKIVHYNYLCNVRQYFSRIILERLQREKIYVDANGRERKEKKKDIEREIVKTSQNWIYDYAINYTSCHQDLLDEYHDRIPEFYSDRSLSDEELDKRILV